MEFLGFFVNVWAAVLIGLFVIAMVIGCTFDRRNNEWVKWWVFIIGAITVIAWQWSTLSTLSFSEVIFNRDMWRSIGTYVALGLAYSLLEFTLDVRRSARNWAERWAQYKKNYTAKSPTVPEEETANNFVQRYTSGTGIIGVEINSSATRDNGESFIQPHVNRGELAAYVGAWTLFWPFYAISLIVGDLLSEIFRVIADVLANVSGRFVRLAFRNVFK